jgi:Cyclic nucleotide-binding domain
MRVTSSVTSVSWIPSEAITGTLKVPFVLGVDHFDPPPPDVIDDVDDLLSQRRVRFVNNLRAWIDVVDGEITGAGYDGRGYLGSTTLRFGVVRATLSNVSFPDIQLEPEIGDGRVRFVQTAGGRTAAPAPRRVNRPPYIQIIAPTAWTTLELTVHADGSAQHALVGASPFPRHWIYDDTGTLVAKSGFIDFKSWAGDNFGDWSPWGDRDQAAIVAEAESALERQLSTIVMRGGARPKIRTLAPGAILTEQGAPGAELYLVLDGMLIAEVNGEPVAELGPGAIIGERALLEGGTRTATVRATTPCKVAAAHADQLDRDALIELSGGHRREDRPTPGPAVD